MTSINSDKISDSVAKILFDSGCIIFRTRTPFKFTSGILSPIYVDNRQLISMPKMRGKVVNYLVEKIKEAGIPDIVAGTATAGIPHAAWIAQKINLPMVYVRSEPKKHGRGNQVEGLAKRGQSAIVIEDLISTGKSSIEVINALRKLGVKVDTVLAIYSHGLPQAEENFKKAKVNLIVLTDLPHTIKAAQKSGFFRPNDEVANILEWQKDPQTWGKKMGFE